MNTSRLNYKHLRYLYEVGRLGSVQQAADALRVSTQAVSAQIKQLEDRMGQALLQRRGRRVVLTDAGQLAMRYAQQIFDLGDELSAALSDHPGELTLPMRIGVTDSVPKAMAVTATAAGMARYPDREAMFVEGAADDLLARLLTGRLHALLSDREPAHDGMGQLDVRMLVRSPLVWVAPPGLLDDERRPFPDCLSGQPMILWQGSSVISSQVSAWLRANGVRPRVAARCVDSALMKSLCAAGVGVAPIPLAIAEAVRAQLGLVPIGTMDDVEMTLWVIQRAEEAGDYIDWPAGDDQARA